LSKGDSPLDEWCKQIAPSIKLRRWYHHDPARHAEFSHRYLDELQEPARRLLSTSRHTIVVV
jgi:uncharacterized protein YeaO (DUF488 family)